jgi:hypothetical protein
MQNSKGTPFGRNNKQEEHCYALAVVLSPLFFFESINHNKAAVTSSGELNYPKDFQTLASIDNRRL